MQWQLHNDQCSMVTAIWVWMWCEYGGQCEWGHRPDFGIMAWWKNQSWSLLIPVISLAVPPPTSSNSFEGWFLSFSIRSLGFPVTIYMWKWCFFLNEWGVWCCPWMCSVWALGASLPPPPSPWWRQCLCCPSVHGTPIYWWPGNPDTTREFFMRASSPW